MLLAQQLATTASKNLARAVLNELGKEHTYGDLRTAIAKLSYLYQHELIGAAPKAAAAPLGQTAQAAAGQIRMGLFARNGLAFLKTFYAMTNIRAVTIPIHPDIGNEEAASWIRLSKVTHLGVTSDLLSRARDVLREGHLNVPIIEIERKQGGEYDASFKAAPDNTPLETDPVLCLRTAGITGRPKFVHFNHKQLQHAGVALRGLYHLNPSDRILTSLSWAHPFAFAHGLLLPLMNGATAIVDQGLQALEFLDYLIAVRATRLVLVPSQCHKILVTCRNEKRTLPGLKSVTVGIGQLSPELVKVFTLLNVGVAQCYGVTENLWTIAMGDTESRDHASEGRGYIGRGLPGLKYKVLDENGDEIPGPDERTGRLALAGPTVMSGYLDLEKETKNAIRGTWLYTEDTATLRGKDEELEVIFQGRMSDVVRVEDEIVDLPRLDGVIRKIQGVLDAACFGVKNSHEEIVVVCAVVRAAGVQVLDKHLNEGCMGKIPAHLMPKAWVFTDVIPRDAGGNIVYLRLRGQFAGAAG